MLRRSQPLGVAFALNVVINCGHPYVVSAFVTLCLVLSFFKAVAVESQIQPPLTKTKVRSQSVLFISFCTVFCKRQIMHGNSLSLGGSRISLQPSPSRAPFSTGQVLSKGGLCYKGSFSALSWNQNAQYQN